MARFPLKEAEVLALSQEMASGLAANVAVYSSPPVSLMDLASALSRSLLTENKEALDEV